MTPNDEIWARLEDVEHRQEGQRGVDEDDTRWLCSTVREQAQRIERLERALRDVQDCDEDVVCSIAEAALRGTP